MKNFLENIFPLLLIGIVAALFFIFVPAPTHQVVNCSLVEISPDFTPEHRKECRLLRGTKL